MRAKQIRAAGSIAAVLVALASTLGCTLDRWAEVSPGEYVPVGGIGAASRAAAREIRQLTIDCEQQTAVFTLRDGAQVHVSFVPRPRSEWPSGCPANVNATRMQILDVTEAPLAIGPLTIDEPVLVRDCPRQPAEVVVRAAGEIGGGGSACTGASECIRFERSE